MKVGKWSQTAANNNATPPDGWPEGQAPSTVNDCARELMAQVRVMAADLQYVDLAHTPSYLTSTTFSLGAADATNFEVGRRLKLFDTTTLYGTIDSVSGTFVSVRLDAGSLTTSLSSVAVGILKNSGGALPEAAFSQQNAIINGDMDIWQRGTFFGNPSNFEYTADRFMYEEANMTGSGSITQKTYPSSVSAVPTVVQAGRFITNALAFIATATQTTLNSSSYSMLTYNVEGYDFRTIAHQPLGLGFWINTNLSGVYSVAIRSGAVSASYVTTFTVTAVGTAQHFFLQIPATPATPYNWDYTSGSGLRISWVFACGTDLQVTNLNEWTAGNLVAAPTQANLFNAPFNEFAITGITLKRGWADVPLVTRRYGDELALCQRYYWRGLPGLALNGPSFAVGCVLSWPVMFPTLMRDVPNLGFFAPGAVLVSISSATVGAATTSGFRLLAFTNAVNGNCNMLFDVTTDYLDADAEL